MEKKITFSFDIVLVDSVTFKYLYLFLIQIKSRLMLNYRVFSKNDPHAAAVNFFVLTQLPGS